MRATQYKAIKRVLKEEREKAERCPGDCRGEPGRFDCNAGCGGTGKSAVAPANGPKQDK